MKTIYRTKGKAKEYGELALNIYTGCPHECSYCSMKTLYNKSDLSKNVVPRENIVEETRKRLSIGDIKGEEVFLCFTCDPFPMGVDTSVTYEIIRLIKESGNRVAILTKGEVDEDRLFALLDENDRFGVTMSCGAEMAKKEEPGAASIETRFSNIKMAKAAGIKTFVSCEPVLDTEFIYTLIKMGCGFIDEYRIGKLNYVENDTNWKEFGENCVKLCKEYHRNYMIKAGLRKEMEKIQTL